MLSIDQMARYHRDGFLAIVDFVSPEACATLLERATEIVAAFEPGERRTTFRTDGEQVGDRELLASGAGIWCFFEPDAVGTDGSLPRDTASSINKIGHAMHDLDPVFEAFTYTRELATVAADIGLTDPLAVQSMYLFKQPRIGGEVRCHQDATFLYTDPVSVTGFWFAIQDATIDNGCLWVQPGGHRGPLRRVYQRVDAGSGVDDATTRFVELDDTPLPAPPARAAADRRAARDDGRAPRPAAALERRQPLPRQPARLQRALRLGVGDVPGIELAAAPARAAVPARRRGQPGVALTAVPAALPTGRRQVLRNLAPAERERGASETVRRRSVRRWPRR